MALPPTGSELSPLDQIRQIETDVTRQIAAARVSAGRSAEEARLQAAAIKTQAQDAGRRDGQARYQEIVLRAGEEAQAILAQANRWIVELQHSASQRMDLAVQQAISMLIGFEDHGEDP